MRIILFVMVCMAGVATAFLPRVILSEPGSEESLGVGQNDSGQQHGALYRASSMLLRALLSVRSLLASKRSFAVLRMTLFLWVVSTLPLYVILNEVKNLLA